MAMDLAPQVALDSVVGRTRPRGQILKWVGNKFRYAELIATQLPEIRGTYFEPFLGTGAVLATVAPQQAVGSDTLAPLVDLLTQVRDRPQPLIAHYEEGRADLEARGVDAYNSIKARFNRDPNAGDLLLISRACYGGVVRFRRDGYLSTPMGPHRPMGSTKLAGYVEEWRGRLVNTELRCEDFERTLSRAGDGDVVYCDPPYVHGQRILYGAQDFSLERLWKACAEAKERGALVALSIDGFRKSGLKPIALTAPATLFEREMLIARGGCMLRRLQIDGHRGADEQVADRLLLSW